MEQGDVLRYVVRVLESQNIPYAVVGSIASAAYGEPRFTRDIDIVVQLARAQVDQLCRAFPDDEFYASSAAAEAVATKGQFKVIHLKSGYKIDFMIGRDDAWGRTQLSRRIRRPLFDDLDVYLAAPEDVILGKLWYYNEGGSDKHLRDIAAMLDVSAELIDISYIDEWSARLGLTGPWKAAQRREE